MQSSTASPPPSSAPEMAAWADLPLIDPRAMSDWCDDMEKADVLDVLARVPYECARCLADIKKAIAESDLLTARRSAHRLKGMASNLGAARLARLARTIELASQSVEDVSSRMASLEKTSAETLEAIRAYC